MEPTDDDLEAYCNCFCLNGVSKTPEHVRWQVLDCPGPHLVVTVADGEDPRTGEALLAGIQAMISVNADIDGVTVPACQSIDTIVDANFRGQGLFKRLVNDVNARATEQGCGFVYGFPNGNSAHGFFERLGWTNLDPVPMMTRVLRTGAVFRWSGALAFLDFLDLPVPIRRHRLRVGALELVEIDRFDDRFDALWDRFRSRIRCAIRRDAAYLNWRMVDKPEHTYRHAMALRQGKLVGFVSWRETKKHGGGVGYLVELVAEPDESWIGRVLLSHALREMRRAGMDVARAMSMPGTPTHEAYWREGFFWEPERMSDELHFGARAFREDLAEAVADRGGWYLSLLDSDTV